jgi:hypothetical protein
MCETLKMLTLVLSGDLSTTDSRFGASDEQSMDCTILATVLKRYLASLIIPVIPAEHHVNFLEISSGESILKM